MMAGESPAGDGAKSRATTASGEGAGSPDGGGVPAAGTDGASASAAGKVGWLRRAAVRQWRLGVATAVTVAAVAMMATCHFGQRTVGREMVLCDRGEFRLPSMDACRPLLDCSELAELEIMEQIGQGSTKSVYRSVWRGQHEVAVATLAEPALRDDFVHGLRMLRALSPSEHVVQLVGHCGDVIVTEFHRRGDAAAAAAEEARAAGAGRALALCRSYAAALAFLHESPAGRRVMCDSNELSKTLEQWLVADDGRLVVADLDALPDASAGPVLCGRRRIEGAFLAPEQRWRQGREPPGYDEKTDVWKLAAVCEHFLSAARDGEYLRLELHAIHRRCRSVPARLRPSAAEVVAEYDRVLQELDEEEYVSMTP